MPPTILDYIPWLILMAAYGACVGSFLNVVIYRLPAGQSLVRPRSHCPKCQHRLAWYDNIPVLGWLWLRGKCRYCRAPIAIQYPLVEALTAVFFCALFYGYYMKGLRTDLISVGDLANASPLAATWPILALHLVAVAALLAATAIDVRLYIVPLPIPNLIAGAAAVATPIIAWFLARPPGQADAALRAIPHLSDGRWLGVAAGAVLGLVIANLLLVLKILPRSFPVPDAEEEHEDSQARPDGKQPDGATKTDTAGGQSPAADEAAAEPRTAGPRWRYAAIGLLILVSVLLWAFGGWLGFAAAVAILWMGVLPLSVMDAESMSAEEAAQFLEHPQPRVEVLKELLFLLPPGLGALLGWHFGPAGAAFPPAVQALGGVAMGYLAGGLIVWLVRIFGTMVFGKEAMGLGDVHLLAGAGAILGWQDAIIVFFLAPFMGLLAAVVGYGVSRLAKGQVRLIPFGPYLAGATVVMLLFRDPIRALLVPWAP